MVAVVLLLGLACCAGLGAYVSSVRGRSPAEGAIFGLLLGPFGVIVAALLPAPDPASRAAAASRWNIDERGLIASIADRYRTLLDAEHPGWEGFPHHRRKRLIALARGRVRGEFGLSKGREVELLRGAESLLLRREDAA
jgi:hypothetical protein